MDNKSKQMTYIFAYYNEINTDKKDSSKSNIIYCDELCRNSKLLTTLMETKLFPKEICDLIILYERLQEDKLKEINTQYLVDMPFFKEEFVTLSKEIVIPYSLITIGQTIHDELLNKNYLKCQTKAIKEMTYENIENKLISDEIITSYQEDHTCLFNGDCFPMNYKKFIKTYLFDIVTKLCTDCPNISTNDFYCKADRYLEAKKIQYYFHHKYTHDSKKCGSKFSPKYNNKKYDECGSKNSKYSPDYFSKKYDECGSKKSKYIQDSKKCGSKYSPKYNNKKYDERGSKNSKY